MQRLLSKKDANQFTPSGEKFQSLLAQVHWDANCPEIIWFGLFLPINSSICVDSQHAAT